MKLKKKFLAVLVAVIAIFAMAMTTMAADTVNGTITGLSSGDTVKYAQIIQLNAAKDAYELTDFGKTAIDLTDTNLDTAAKVLAVLVGKDGAQQVNGNLAKVLAAYDANIATYATTTTADTNGVVTFPISGAYVAQATAGANAEPGTVYTPLMLVSAALSYENGTLVGVEADSDTTVAAKKYTTGVKKEIADEANDVDADGNDIHSYYSKDKDATIGKTINYKVTVDIPDYPADTTNHTLYIYDKFSAGIDFVSGSVKYQIVDKSVMSPVEANWVTATTAANDDQVVEYSNNAAADFALYWDYDGLELSSAKKIFVTYQGQLNANAIVGVEGNPNKVTEVYSNTPGKGTGYKPGDVPQNPDAPGAEDSHKNEGYNKLEDEETVYTYGFYVVKRASGTNDILVGAEFDVYTAATGGTKIGTFTTNAEGIGGLAGIPAGDYWLEETKAPAGYSKLTSREKVTTGFVYSEKVTKTTTVSSWTTTSGTTYAAITADVTGKTQAKNAAGKLLYILSGVTTPVTKDEIPEGKVEGTDYWPAYVVSEYGNKVVNGETTDVVTNETIYGDEGKEGTAKEIPGYEVLNTKIGALPSTGGVGTVVFTFGGVALMILGAAMFFVIRKKRAAM